MSLTKVCALFYCFYNCYLVHLLVLVLGKHLLHHRLAPEMVEDLVMLKCNLRLLRNMSTV